MNYAQVDNLCRAESIRSGTFLLTLIITIVNS
jgi:hypothetical protein